MSTNRPISREEARRFGKQARRSPHFFVAGGTLHRHALSYVKRPADDELLQQVWAGQFCYVLTSRQMGKSSLMVRTVERLKGQQVKTVIIDLSQIGTATADQWYLGLLTRIARKLRLSVNPTAWWQEQASLSMVQRFTDYLLDIALREVAEQIIIFIDEIDTSLRFDFSDDFFAAIRAMYNARAHDSAFERLTFVLLGVASPSNLIKEHTRTPFNIGYRITLQGFTRKEATLLQAGLKQSHSQQGELIFNRIYHWTSGHPYLTQKLCLAAAKTKHQAWTEAAVDQLVEQLFLSIAASKETNLQFVQEQLLAHKESQKLLELYSQVYNGTDVPDNQQSALQNQLKLSGLVKERGGSLKISNQIYRCVFDQGWIREHYISKRGQLLERLRASFEEGSYSKGDVILIGTSMLQYDTLLVVNDANL